jgi:hypothetical protein
LSRPHLPAPLAVLALLSVPALLASGKPDAAGQQLAANLDQEHAAPAAGAPQQIAINLNHEDDAADAEAEAEELLEIPAGSVMELDEQSSALTSFRVNGVELDFTEVEDAEIPRTFHIPIPADTAQGEAVFRLEWVDGKVETDHYLILPPEDEPQTIIFAALHAGL